MSWNIVFNLLFASGLISGCHQFNSHTSHCSDIGHVMLGQGGIIIDLCDEDTIPFLDIFSIFLVPFFL
jgi:hypothetical protein